MPRIRLLLPVTAVLVLGLALVEMRSVGPPPAPVHGAFGHGPTVVLVHGLGSRSEDWLPVARRLARRFRVELVELPGHGSSDMPEPFSLDQAARALERTLADEKDGPVVLVGHSIGGLVAMSAALDMPERVRALVLVETMLKPQITGAARDALLHGLDSNYDAVLRTAYTSFGRDSAQGEALYREVASQDPANMKRWIRLALTADLSQRAVELRVPVLAVLAPNTWPATEPWTVTSEAIGYANVPRVEPVRVEQCGHFVMLDQPDALAGLITRFASRPAQESIAALHGAERTYRP